MVKFLYQVEEHHKKIDLENNAQEFTEEKIEITYYKIRQSLEKRIRANPPIDRVTKSRR